MAVSGLQSEAVLKLKVQLDSKDIRGTKKLLTDLTNAFKAQSNAKGTDALAVALKNMRSQLAAVKKELNGYKQASQAAKAADKQAADAKKAQLNAYKQLAAAIIRQRVVLEANVKAAQKQNTLDRARQAQLRNLARQEQLVATAIANTIRVNAAQANAKKRATAEAKKATEQAKAEAKALKELEARLNAEAKALAAVEKRAKLTSTAMGRMRDFIDRIVKATKEAEKNFDALFRASYRLNMVGNMFKNAAQSVMDFGSGIMQSFGDFEYMMIRAAGTMEIWYDAADRGELTYANLQDRILGLAQSMKMFPAKDIAEAMYFWGSTTGQVVKTQEDLAITTESLDTIMKAAVMTNTSYEQTIKGVYSILQQYYGGALSYASEVTEKLFYTTQKTAAEFSDLIAAFKMVGPIAAQMGTSFDEVNETIATLADLGLRGTMAGRALRQMFIQTIRPSGPAGKAMEQLFAMPDVSARFDGKKFNELVFPNGKYVGITKQVEILAKATINLTQAERGYYLAKISTANELPMLTALVARQTVELKGLATAEDKLADSGTKAAISFQKNWEGMSQSWNAVKGSLDRAIESLRINIGSIMAQVLKPLLDTFTLVIKRVEAFIKLNPGIVKFFTQIGAAVGTVSAVVGQFLVMAGAAAGVAAAFGVIVSVAKALSDAFKYIVGVGGALTVVFLAIIDNAQYVYDGIAEIGTNLQEAFGSGEDAAIDFGSALETITRPARELVGWIVRLATDIGVWISEIIKVISQVGILKDALNILIQVISVLVSARIIVGLAQMARGFLGIGAALGGMTAAANAAGGAIGGVMSRILAGGITNAFSPVGWAMLAASIGLVALQIPEVQDALNLVIGSTDRWGKSVENLENKFKELGSEIGQMTLEGMEDMLGWEQMFTDANEDHLSGRVMSTEGWKEMFAADKLREQGKEMSAFVNEQIEKGFDVVNRASFFNDESLISEADWAKLIINLTKDLGGPQNASLANSIAVRLSSVLGKETTISELFKLWTSKAFGDIDFGEFIEASGYFTNLGRQSTKASEHAMQIIQAGFGRIKEGDLAEMNKFITAPLQELMGYSISAVAGGEAAWATPELQAAAGELLNGFQNAVATETENQAASIGGYEATLKRALESMIIIMFEDSWPDYYVVAAELEGLALNADWEAVADLMMGTDAIIEAIKNNRPGSSEFKSIADMIIDYGYGSPEFIAKFAEVAEAAETAGEEIGRTTTQALIDGIIEGADSGLDRKRIRELKKLGSPEEIMTRAFKQSNRLKKFAFGRGSTAATRMAWREDRKRLNALYDTEKQLRVGRPRANKNLDEHFLKQNIPEVQSMTPGLKRQIIQRTRNIAEKRPKLVRQALRGYPSLLGLVFNEDKVQQRREARAIAEYNVLGGPGWGNAVVEGAVKPIEDAAKKGKAGSPANKAGKDIAIDVIRGVTTIDSASNIDAVKQSMWTLISSATAAVTGSAGGVDYAYEYGVIAGNRWKDGVVAALGSAGDILGGAMPFGGLDNKGVSITTEDKKEVTVHLQVTSPDGSVNRQRQSDVRKGAQKAMTMAGIEHYATIGRTGP